MRRPETKTEPTSSPLKSWRTALKPKDFGKSISCRRRSQVGRRDERNDFLSDKKEFAIARRDAQSHRLRADLRGVFLG